MKVVIPDKVSKMSAKIFEENGFEVEHRPSIDIGKCNEISKGSEALVVRSYDLHELELSDSLLAIGRSGAGVNNIPVEKCTEKGIVVFNTPGANANAVKELVLCGLFLSSRKIVDGVNWTVCQKEHGEKVSKLVEENKSQFKGNEIKGKRLGVVGLGAVGMLVANDALALGMNVMGYDPFISIDNAWKLSRDVGQAKNLDSLIKNSDYITLHVPLNDKTNRMINNSFFKKMKKGVRIMNFSREEIINTQDLIGALKSGIVGNYVTDFPNCELIGVPNVICIPHLGASTEEAEENCAVMVTEQLVDFLKNGNVVNSVNFPTCKMERNGNTRITVINKNIPGMIEKVTTVIADEKLNIEEMINKSRGEMAYSFFDVSGDVNERIIGKLKDIEGVVRVRKL